MSSGKSERLVTKEKFLHLSSRVADYLVMVMAGMLLLLFAFGLAGQLYDYSQFLGNGGFLSIGSILQIVDGFIVLLVVLEVFRGLQAYLKNIAVIPSIVDIALLAILRNIITFRVDESFTGYSPLIEAVSYLLVVLAVLAAYYMVKIKNPRKDLQRETTETI